jgi:hypothetical protein
MVSVVTSVVLWLLWSHRWCYGCRGRIRGVMVFDNQAALITKRKDWLALNQDNVPEWIDMSTRGLLL